MKHLRAPLLFVLAVPFTAAVLLAAVLAPTPAAEAQSLQEYMHGVEVEGDVLYVIVHFRDDGYQVHDSELRVYDVSDQLSPVQVGTLSVPQDRVRSLEVKGDLAYLDVPAPSDAGYKNFLWVVGVSDPSNPTVLDQSVEGGGPKVHGRYVYIRTPGEYVLSVYRIDDDGHPQLVSSTAFPPESESLDVSPSAIEESMYEIKPVLDWPYLYAFRSITRQGERPPSYLETTRRINVSKPANPVAAGEYTVPARHLEPWSVRDGVFYAVDYSGYPSDEQWLFVADVDGWWDRAFRSGAPADPSAGVNDYEMWWGRYLFVATQYGSTIYDFGGFSFPTGKGDVSILYQDLSMAHDTAVRGAAHYYEHDVIYLARGEGGLDVVQAPFPTPTLDNHLYFPAAP